MSTTLQKQAEASELRKTIAFNRLQEASAKRYLQFANKNLSGDRKRRAGYSPTPGRADRDLNNSDRHRLISESRQMVEENPLAVALLTRHLDYVVGTGYNLSIRSEDAGFNEEAEAAWGEYSNALDIRRMVGWGEWLRMVQARRMVDGDVFLLEADNQYAIIEADRCYAPQGKLEHPGIDYDEMTGAPEGYWFGRRAKSTEAQSAIEAKRYDRQRVLHYMHNPDYRAERERGVSAFLSLLNLVKDVDENLENMDIKIKNESILGLIFKTDPVSSPEGGLLSSFMNGGAGATGSPEDRPYVKLQPGMNLELMPGETAELLEMKNPRGSYMDYIRFRLRFVGLTFGFPLEFLLLDAVETNYSGLMMLAQMVRKAIKTYQAQLTTLADSIYKRWLTAFAAGVRSLPVYYTRHDWGRPGVGFVDIAKEVRAFSELINLNLASRQDVLSILGDGKDFENVIGEVKSEQDFMKDSGVMYEIGKPGAVIANLEEGAAATATGGINV